MRSDKNNNNFNNNLLGSVKELLTRELKLCQTLRAMISRELEAIVLDGDMDELLRILNKKSDIISQLQLLADSWHDVLNDADIDADINVNDNAKVKARVNETEGLVACKILAMFPDNDEITLLLDQTKNIADSIIKAEDQAKEELEKYAAGLRQQMASRTHGRNAAASYAKMGGSII